MKNICFFLVLFITAMMMIMALGCKNEVAGPLWDQTAPTVAGTPTITSVIPVQATAGVNTITIQGVGFSDSLSDMSVYFNSTTVEILNNSSTSITVRRPNVASSTAIIKVVSAKAYIAGKMSPYRVDQVFDKYGSFLDNIALGPVCFNGDTMYVLQTASPYYWYRVTPNGIKSTDTLTGLARRIPYDVRIHNGFLCWMGNNREILQVNLTTRVASRWIQLPSGVLSKFGDFGSNNYFYTGATGTDLCIVPPTAAGTLLTSVAKEGEYLAEEILAVRICNNYVYVASRTNKTTPVIIYKHLIGTGATLGLRQLVVDMSTTVFSSRTVKALSFSSSGTMFVITDAPNPILIFNGTKLDYFYKDIVTHNVNNAPSFWLAKQAYWGSTNNLYLIGNDSLAATSAADKWNVLKVDMGTTGVPYY
jgi:hypothetical protein